LSTTNPTWLDPDLNPGGKPATNRLSHSAALYSTKASTTCTEATKLWRLLRN
jgi:hypothetical protein